MTLKASNTNVTLAPKSIYEVAGVPENEPVQEIGLSTKHEHPLVMDTADAPFSETPVLTVTVPAAGDYTFTVTGHDDPVPVYALKDTETVYGPPLDNLRKLMTGDFEALPKDDDCFAYTPDEPENDLSLTERRIQRLEEQMDGLLDRLAKYNVRAQHRI